MAIGRVLRRWSFLGALLCLGQARAQPASAEAGAGAPRWPFRAALRVDAATARASYEHPRDAAPGLRPELPPSRAMVGQQAARAHAALVAERFVPVGEGAADLVLSVGLQRAEVGLDTGGWYASVTHLAVLADAGGAELGRWRAEGWARLSGRTAAALPEAFAAAASAAARQLGRRLEEEPTEAWLRWQRERGLAPTAPAAAAARAGEGARPPPPPPRAARSWVLEAGAAALGAGEARAVGALVRGGWQGEWVAGQASLRAWPTDFTAAPPSAWGQSRATLDVVELGVEAVVPVRIGRELEGRLGAGVQLLHGRGRTTVVPLADPSTTRRLEFSGTEVTGSLTLGARYVSALQVAGGRARLGLDVRRDFGGPLRLGAAGRDLTVAGWSVAVVAGVEWPAAWSPAGP